MLGSSKSERLAIDNLKKVKDLFATARGNRNRNKNKNKNYNHYWDELQAKYKRIDNMYGSIDKYQKLLEGRLDAIGIKI